MITVLPKNNNGRWEKLPDTLYAPVIDGKELSWYAETEDIALLFGLGYKYGGPNSRFVQFACRMLGIESEWAR